MCQTWQHYPALRGEASNSQQKADVEKSGRKSLRIRQSPEKPETFSAFYGVK